MIRGWEYEDGTKGGELAEEAAAAAPPPTADELAAAGAPGGGVLAGWISGVWAARAAKGWRQQVRRAVVMQAKTGAPGGGGLGGRLCGVGTARAGRARGARCIGRRWFG